MDLKQLCPTLAAYPLLLVVGLSTVHATEPDLTQEEQGLEASSRMQEEQQESDLERRRLSEEQDLEVQLQVGDEQHEAELESALDQLQRQQEKREEAQLQQAAE